MYLIVGDTIGRRISEPVRRYMRSGCGQYPSFAKIILNQYNFIGEPLNTDVFTAL